MAAGSGSGSKTYNTDPVVSIGFVLNLKIEPKIMCSALV